jgi:pimeloyl-ACP methyl ester carboxylesterase
MSYIKIQDRSSRNPVKIFYEDWGQGKPVVLIHGWPLNHQMWEYQINDLVDSGHRVIAYDRRGFGKSSKPYGPYDYDTLADDLRALLDNLELNDVTLVGFSMGGGEVVRYISRHGSARVARIALISAITPSMLKTDENPNGVDNAVFEEMLNSMKNDRIDFLDGFGKQFFGVSLINKPVSTPLLEYYRMHGSLASPKATQECAKAFAYTNFTNDLAAIKIPTLIIHGDADKTVPIEGTAERAAKLIPNSTYIKYDGAPHGLFYTEREKLNKDLIAFLKQPVLARV